MKSQGYCHVFPDVLQSAQDSTDCEEGSAMLHPNRYRVDVTCTNGVVYTDHADHHLELQPTRFLLEKKVRNAEQEVQGVSYLDTETGRPPTNEEIYAE